MESLETPETPKINMEDIPRTVISTLSNYVLVYMVVDKLNFSWNLMGSGFTGTSGEGPARNLTWHYKNICTKHRSHEKKKISTLICLGMEGKTEK